MQLLLIRILTIVEIKAVWDVMKNRSSEESVVVGNQTQGSWLELCQCSSNHQVVLNASVMLTSITATNVIELLKENPQDR